MNYMQKGAELYATLAQWLINNPSSAFLVVLFLAVFLGILGIAAMSGNRGSVSRRLAGDSISIGALGRAPRLRQESKEGFWNSLIAGIEKRVPLVDEANRSTMRRRLIQAGFMGPNAVRTYYAVRLIMTVALPLAFVFVGPLVLPDMNNQKIIIIAMILCVAGLYLPSSWLARRIANRQRAIAEAFPDALDMMVVCVEAGLGLDASFNRVGSELTRSHPALATQLALVSLELRAGKSRSDALRNLSERIGLDEVNSFVTLLIQSDNLGTSISQALTVHADEMRTKRMLRAEEQANKLPVKLTIPLLLFILPCMVTVIMLPAIITIVRDIIPALGGN